LSEIAALCREAKFEKGAFIFRESDAGREFYLIMVVMVKEDVGCVRKRGSVVYTPMRRSNEREHTV